MVVKCTTRIKCAELDFYKKKQNFNELCNNLIEDNLVITQCVPQ